MKGFYPWHDAVLSARRHPFVLIPRIWRSRYGGGLYIRWGRRRWLCHPRRFIA